uniref:Uncharacterized protein n=1 Tax=Ralstonia solanacearum TaxID=305 RepID=A0A0S4WPM3_RALSL|nr:protein of unknown function [Ralstonia solanacearum]
MFRRKCQTALAYRLTLPALARYGVGTLLPISMRTAPLASSIRCVPALLPVASTRVCAKQASKQPLV